MIETIEVSLHELFRACGRQRPSASGPTGRAGANPLLLVVPGARHRRRGRLGRAVLAPIPLACAGPGTLLAAETALGVSLPPRWYLRRRQVPGRGASTCQAPAHEQVQDTRHGRLVRAALRRNRRSAVQRMGFTSAARPRRLGCRAWGPFEQLRPSWRRRVTAEGVVPETATWSKTARTAATFGGAGRRGNW
jgi:hypothetical protein